MVSLILYSEFLNNIVNSGNEVFFIAADFFLIQYLSGLVVYRNSEDPADIDLVRILNDRVDLHDCLDVRIVLTAVFQECVTLLDSDALAQYFYSVDVKTRLHSTFIPSMSIVFAPPFTSSSASSLRAASIMFISSVILFSPLILDYQVVLVFWLSPYIELYVAGLLRVNFYLYFYNFFLICIIRFMLGDVF